MGKKSVAPNLEAYFACLEKAANDQLKQMGGGSIEGALGALGDMFDQNKVAEMQRKQEAVNKELQVHVKASFARHDVDKTGVLSAEESQAFIQHYVDLFVDFHKRNDVAMQQKAMEANMKMMQGMAGMMGMSASDMKKEAQAELKKGAEAMKKQFEDMRSNYTKNKAEFDKKAFAVADAKKNSKLEEQEVVDVLTPDTEKYQEFHAALGLMPSRAEQMQQVQGMQTQVNDCPQQ